MSVPFSVLVLFYLIFTFFSVYICVCGSAISVSSLSLFFLVFLSTLVCFSLSASSVTSRVFCFIVSLFAFLSNLVTPHLSLSVYYLIFTVCCCLFFAILCLSLCLQLSVSLLSSPSTCVYLFFSSYCHPIPVFCYFHFSCCVFPLYFLLIITLSPASPFLCVSPSLSVFCILLRSFPHPVFYLPISGNKTTEAPAFSPFTPLPETRTVHLSYQFQGRLSQNTSMRYGKDMSVVTLPKPTDLSTFLPTCLPRDVPCSPVPRL